MDGKLKNSNKRVDEMVRKMQQASTAGPRFSLLIVKEGHCEIRNREIHTLTVPTRDFVPSCSHHFLTYHKFDFF